MESLVWKFYYGKLILNAFYVFQKVYFENDKKLFKRFLK